MIANRHNTEVEIAHAERLHKSSVCGIANEGVGHIGQNRVDAVLFNIDRHHLMIHFVQLHSHMAAKTAKPNQ